MITASVMKELISTYDCDLIIWKRVMPTGVLFSTTRKTSKFDWTPDKIRTEKIISDPS